ncbi:hypothetical protein D9756_010098 [Leucocoprinus leucothites]|uniref:Uncharacterized protein n=1 Tax=Leucocoprinus leucothites TaxID=201217 RepID=A0A8H5CSD4_9AGAR|nr:hypothetical protein D9756_010098 [Leucoagaricus leucothites]
MSVSKIFVKNYSSEEIDCFVSQYSRSEGSDSWFPLDPQQGDAWARKSGGWELVAFRRRDSGENAPRAGKYVAVGRGRIVQFYGFEDIRVD